MYSTLLTSRIHFFKRNAECNSTGHLNNITSCTCMFGRDVCKNNYSSFLWKNTFKVVAQVVHALMSTRLDRVVEEVSLIVVVHRRGHPKSWGGTPNHKLCTFAVNVTKYLSVVYRLILMRLTLFQQSCFNVLCICIFMCEATHCSSNTQVVLYSLLETKNTTQKGGQLGWGQQLYPGGCAPSTFQFQLT